MHLFNVFIANRFTAFGSPVPHRPVEDLAFAVARFIQKGGSFVNYYMVRSRTFVFQFPVIIYLYTSSKKSNLHISVNSSIMEEQTLVGQLVAPSFQQAMTMMPQLMNMVW